MEQNRTGNDRRIDRIFSEVYGRYDLLNTLFSLGLDRGWRAEAAKIALSHGGEKLLILDAASGTGELAMSIARLSPVYGKDVEITLADRNARMLSVAREKVREAGLSGMRLCRDDALHMRFPSSSFDVVVTAFSLRNFDSVDLFSKELLRVLRPGGMFVVLEMGAPEKRLWRHLSGMQLSLIALLARLSGNEGYGWLVSSVRGFDRRAAAGIFRSRFKNVRVRSLPSDVAFLIWGHR